MEYEPDADMIFNYLMVSALAAATDYVEKEGLKPSGGETVSSIILRQWDEITSKTFIVKRSRPALA